MIFLLSKRAFLIFFVFLSIFFTLLPQASSQNLPLIVNGEEKGNIPLMVFDRITYVSPEDLVRSLGGSFKYNPANGTFSFTIGKKDFQLQINNPTALVDGKIRLLDSFPKVVGNKIFVPLNFILENTAIQFDSNKRVLFIGELPAAPVSQRETVSLPGKEESPSTSSLVPAVNMVSEGSKSEISLSRIRYYSADRYTRIVFDLSKVPEYEVSTQGETLVVILKDVKASKEEVYKIRDGLVKDVEVLKSDGDTKIKIGVEGTPPYRNFTLENPPRLVLDVLKKPKDSVVSIAGTKPSSEKKDSSKAIVPSPEVPKVSGRGKLLVMIDPGHGGRDPGAIGPMGTREKDIVLRISLYLKKELMKLGYRVAMTRDKDIYLPLEERTKMANRMKADLFLSIHCNASFSSSAKGSEIYYMALPTDSSAMAVALRENMEIGLGSEEVKRKTDMLVKILEDMMKNAKINESSRLAEEVYDSMSNGKLGIPVRRIAQAPFFVLRGAVMPAILVEVAFISNPREEKLLNSSSWQRKVASLIAKGVNSYLSSLR
ncbi:MAG: N-acetylmuramoyl-L-alanine amidase [bacterium]|nr:MAG: N-acetylmuramoyl-L-alanine amidase [bacterium 42_11]MDK2871647.1 N-acetylmuramoyl-L-alanine amidase [bacterium]